MLNLTKEIDWIKKNWNKIPHHFKKSIRRGDSPLSGLGEDDHVVILLLDRQKPSVQADWSFDEERISVNRDGKVVWGFDSGCSCPAPWVDNYPECYSVSEGWKEFTLNIEKFDHGALEEVLEKINEIKAATE